MKHAGRHKRTIWLGADRTTVEIVDQTRLPHEYVIAPLRTMRDAAHAIRSMQVRGAPLIGATAAYGMALAMRADPSDSNLAEAGSFLAEQRPTAVNLRWAIERMQRVLSGVRPAERVALAYAEAHAVVEEDVAFCRRMGEHGAEIIRRIASGKKPGQRVNILTHCNAGALACIDWGTATAPIYVAHEQGIPIHVWVDETRPRNQGASLTAFELGDRGVPHTLIVDNAGGHYMQAGDVDLCIVGADRVTTNGDVANKIGTYLKALAAKDNGVPFYVALPYSTVDWRLHDGAKIPIEERSADEVLRMSGRLADGTIATVDIAAPGSPARNPGFDVTPARLVTALITERGVCSASREGLLGLYPEEQARAA